MGIAWNSKYPGSNVNTGKPDNANTLQQWYVKKVPGTTNMYVIINVGDNLVLNSYNDKPTQQTFNCGDHNEMFSFTPQANGMCSIVTAKSGNAYSNQGQISGCGLGLGGSFTSPVGSKDQLWTFREVDTCNTGIS